MTDQEREKLIYDMAIAIGCVTIWRPDEKARVALAIAEAAFSKHIEEAYKEGWRDSAPRVANVSQRHRDWESSNARAAILASIPEKKDDRT